MEYGNLQAITSNAHCAIDDRGACNRRDARNEGPNTLAGLCPGPASSPNSEGMPPLRSRARIHFRSASSIAANINMRVGCVAGAPENAVTCDSASCVASTVLKYAEGDENSEEKKLEAVAVPPNEVKLAADVVEASPPPLAPPPTEIKIGTLPSITGRAESICNAKRSVVIWFNFPEVGKVTIHGVWARSCSLSCSVVRTFPAEYFASVAAVSDDVVVGALVEEIAPLVVVVVVVGVVVGDEPVAVEFPFWTAKDALGTNKLDGYRTNRFARNNGGGAVS